MTPRTTPNTDPDAQKKANEEQEKRRKEEERLLFLASEWRATHTHIDLEWRDLHGKEIGIDTSGSDAVVVLGQNTLLKPGYYTRENYGHTIQVAEDRNGQKSASLLKNISIGEHGEKEFKKAYSGLIDLYAGTQGVPSLEFDWPQLDLTDEVSQAYWKEKFDYKIKELDVILNMIGPGEDQKQVSISWGPNVQTFLAYYEKEITAKYGPNKVKDLMARAAQTEVYAENAREKLTQLSIDEAEQITTKDPLKGTSVTDQKADEINKTLGKPDFADSKDVEKALARFEELDKQIQPTKRAYEEMEQHFNRTENLATNKNIDLSKQWDAKATNNKQKRINAISEQKEALKVKVDAWTELANKKEDLLKTSNDKITALTESIKKLEDEKPTYTTDKERYDTLLATLQTDIPALNADFSNAKIREDMLKSEFEKGTTRAPDLRELFALSDKVKPLEADMQNLDQKQKNLADAKTEHQALQDNFTKLETKIQNATQQLVNLNTADLSNRLTGNKTGYTIEKGAPATDADIEKQKVYFRVEDDKVHYTYKDQKNNPIKGELDKNLVNEKTLTELKTAIADKNPISPEQQKILLNALAHKDKQIGVTRSALPDDIKALSKKHADELKDKEAISKQYGRP